MRGEHLLGLVTAGAKAFRASFLENVEDDYELLRGISRADRWPDEAVFRMSEAFPNDLKREDFVSNTNGVLLVSETARQLLDREEGDGVWYEFLPVTIINHKGRKIHDRYFIYNLFPLRNMIDLNESIFVRNMIDPELLVSIEKLVLRQEEAVPPRQAFRLHHYPFVPVFHRELAKVIAGSGLSGIQFTEIYHWPV